MFSSLTSPITLKFGMLGLAFSQNLVACWFKSASSTTTVYPSSASSAPIPTASVVLEHPPLADAMLTTAAIRSPHLGSQGRIMPKAGYLYKCAGQQMEL